MDGCKQSYPIKKRNEHYLTCESFVYYRCRAPICKIIESKDCKCEVCLNHNCFALVRAAADDKKTDENGEDKKIEEDEYDPRLHACKPCFKCTACPQVEKNHRCEALKDEPGYDPNCPNPICMVNVYLD